MTVDHSQPFYIIVLYHRFIVNACDFWCKMVKRSMSALAHECINVCLHTLGVVIKKSPYPLPFYSSDKCAYSQKNAHGQPVDIIRFVSFVNAVDRC